MARSMKPALLKRFSAYGFLKNQQYYDPFLVVAFVQMGLNVVAAPSDEPEESSRKNPYDVFKKKPVTVVPWNRSSLLSSKNLILRGLQRFPNLDAALILRYRHPRVEPARPVPPRRS